VSDGTNVGETTAEHLGSGDGDATNDGIQMAIGGIVDFVRSCGEERTGPLFLPSRISVRTVLRPEPVLSSSLTLVFFSFRPFYHPLVSFVARQAPSVVHIQIHDPPPEIYDFSCTLAFTRADTDCFHLREVPVVLL